MVKVRLIKFNQCIIVLPLSRACCSICGDSNFVILFMLMTEVGGLAAPK